MRDWTPALRTRLAGLKLAPAREAEIVEELSSHLDDRYQELTRSGMSDADAHAMSLDELDDHELLRREMRPLRQSSAPAPIVPGTSRARPAADL
jgi:putative ABC transport system permease protein